MNLFLQILSHFTVLCRPTRLTLYEEKYGILSQDFYTALMDGQLERYDDYDETRTDFSRWKGIYETWQRRKQQADTR